LACEEDNAPNNKDKARIWFFINSGGGDLAATVSVINKMNEIKARGIEIWTVVDGIGWSAAGLISSSGTYRFIKKNSSIFIHLPCVQSNYYLPLILEFASCSDRCSEINSVIIERFLKSNLLVQLNNDDNFFRYLNKVYFKIVKNNLKDKYDHDEIKKIIMG